MTKEYRDNNGIIKTEPLEVFVNKTKAKNGGWVCHTPYSCVQAYGKTKDDAVSAFKDISKMRNYIIIENNMNPLTQKIKENEKLFVDSFYYLQSELDVSLDDVGGKQMEEIKSHINSSTIDLLDTIERWCDGKKMKIRDCNNRYYETRGIPELEKMISYENATINAHNSALTLIQNLIRETKKEIHA